MAGSAGGIKAGAAYVTITADDSQFQRALKNVEQAFGSVAKNIAAVGAGLSAAASAMIAPLALSVGVFESVGSQLNDMAVRTGFSAERLSELSYAAGQTSASIEDVETGIKKMQKAIGEASLGSDEAAKALAKIGLSAEALRSLSPEEQFDVIAGKIRDIKDPAERVAATLGVFGKSGTSLLPLITEMDALTDRARELDIVMSTDAAGAADKLGDAFGDVKKVLQTVQIQIGAALAPALTSISLRLAEVIAPISQWVRDNQALVVSIGSVAVGLAAAGSALVGLAGAVKVAQFALSGVGTVVGVAAGAFNLLVSPLGLAIGLVGGLAAVIVANTDRMGEQIEWLGERFSTLAPLFKDAFGAIVNLLTSGQFGAAGRLAFSGLQLAFEEGKAALTETWASMWRVIVTATATAMAGVERLVAQGAAKVQKIQEDLALALINLAPGLFLTDKESRQLGGAENAAGAIIAQSAADNRGADIDRRLGSTIDEINNRLLDVVDSALGDESDAIKLSRDRIVQMEDEFKRAVASATGSGPGGRLSTEADAFAGDSKKRGPFVPDPADPAGKAKKALDDAIKFAAPVSSFASLRGGLGTEVKALAVADRQLSELKQINRKIGDLQPGIVVGA